MSRYIRPEIGISMERKLFERYTQRARRAIFYARAEALARDSREIEVCDIVLGLTRDSHQTDFPLALLQDDVEKLREMLLGNSAGVAIPKDPRTNLELEIPLSNNGKMAFAYAVEEANRDYRYAIDVDHMLRGVLRTGDPVKPKLILSGYTLPKVRQLSKEFYKSAADLPSPIYWKLKNYLQLHPVLLALIGFAAAYVGFYWQH
jgi:ATP-dependent Clp protease ATP-binding subunit ClpC